MTHTIEPYRHYVAGESWRWEFTVETRDGSIKNLTGVAVEWYLLSDRGDPEADAVLASPDDAGVTATVASADDGLVTVEIEQDVTSDLGGEEYWQRLVLDDDSTGKQVYRGSFPILEA